jgi:hypothetical protein
LPAATSAFGGVTKRQAPNGRPTSSVRPALMSHEDLALQIQPHVRAEYLVLNIENPALDVEVTTAAGGEAELILKGFKVDLQVGVIGFHDQVPALEGEDPAGGNGVVVAQLVPNPRAACLVRPLGQHRLRGGNRKRKQSFLLSGE